MNKPFDPTKPVQTRNGQKARIVAADVKENPFGTILALVTSANSGVEYCQFNYADGSRCKDGSLPSPFDLVNVPEKYEVQFWLNIYPSDILTTQGMRYAVVHGNKASADQSASVDRIACVPFRISFTKGEGLS